MGATEGSASSASEARWGAAKRFADRHRRALLAAGAAAIVFVAVAVFVWASGSTTPGAADDAPAGVEGIAPREGAATAVLPSLGASVVTPAELQAAATESGRALYWAGERPRARLELTRTADGTTYVRYLTGTARAGAPGAGYVVVATYAQPDAYARVTSAARREHYFTADLAGRGRAVIDPDRPQNIYLVHPGQPYQVEVYAPTGDAARKLVFGGAIQPIAP